MKNIKTLSFLLAALMALSSFTISAFAFEDVSDFDFVISNIYTNLSDEDVSYITGWLGDAICINRTTLTTSIDNADYCADLDAENVYQYIASGSSIISAINKYYTKLSSKSRATIFLSYIDYPTVQSKISSYLGITNISHLESLYPDAYNFLYSLYNEESEMKDYTS